MLDSIFEYNDKGRLTGYSVCKSDEKANMLQSESFSNSGMQLSKTVYKYDEGNSPIEISVYTDNQLRNTNEFKVNKDGNLIERLSKNADGRTISIDFFEYEGKRLLRRIDYGSPYYLRSKTEFIYSKIK